MFRAVNTDSTAIASGLYSVINPEISSWTHCRAAPPDSRCLFPPARSAPYCTTLHARPLLSTTPQPVGPAAAGSIPSTLIHPPGCVSAIIVRSLRPSCPPPPQVYAHSATKEKGPLHQQSGRGPKYQAPAAANSLPRLPESRTRQCQNWRKRAVRRHALPALPPAAASASLAPR